MDTHKPKIYIIDDDDAMRSSLRWLIESENYAVHTFPSAEDFLNHQPLEKTGCIITDIRMSGLSGLELYKKLTEMNCALPVIMITGHGDVAMAVKALKDGVYDFIEKPFDDRVLLDRIEQAIQNSIRKTEQQSLKQDIGTHYTSMTKREKEVMDKIVSGLSNKDIAEILDISIKTVEIHRSRVMEKMQAGSLAALVRMSLYL
ncbi:MAG: response regulator [Gammaproteobacteria bacterium]|nr:response regulator [Gammaproteobacteria bacterium]